VQGCWNRAGTAWGACEHGSSTRWRAERGDCR